MKMMPRIAEIIDAESVAQVHVASWQSAFKGLMPDDFLNALSVSERAEAWQKNMHEHYGSLWVIEDAGGNICGFSCSDKAITSREYGFDGEIFGIHIHPKAKRMGYGRQLMASAFSYLQSLDCQNVGLWTLRDQNPARHFYDTLGGKIIAQKTRNFGGRDLETVAYFWEDMRLS